MVKEKGAEDEEKFKQLVAEQEAQVHAEQAQHKVSCCFWHKTTPAAFVCSGF
eukprot:COSAG06_NODE_11012_length_1581_cov_8.002024_4_plen_52_part_00